MISLETSIENLAHVGPRTLPRLKRLGITKVKHLLWHFPSRYEDFAEIIPIDQATQVDTVVSIQGEVQKIETTRAWRKHLNITTAYVADDTESIRVVWFNQPFIERSLPEGTRVSCSGKLKLDKRGIYLSSPSYEKITRDELTHTGRLVPVYPETDGISSKYLRFLIKPILDQLKDVPDPLPVSIVQKFQFPDLLYSLRTIHFPETEPDTVAPRQRFAFEELFFLQLRALMDRQRMKLLPAPRIAFEKENIAALVKSLPFTLTNDQRLAAFEILKDIERSYPMNRLLNGDVGSGKTVVALIAAYQTARAGYQTVFMAPTELLATQHYGTISELVPPGISLGILTGSKKINKDAQIIVGTHAVIQKGVTFNNLGLVVIDEQHRFGVKQRMKLIKDQKLVPHLLSMTATPIPRTLALTIYGDLDVSLIKEKPKGRQEITTKVVSHEKRAEAYQFIEKQIQEGRQIFVICPRIEASEAKTDMKMVTEEFKKLSALFPHRKVAMMHGKMREKGEIMQKFKDHEIDVLVSTSVIEVGVDVPNATIMMIESAERFGLAQLHQFRGRVGRGAHQSYCLLFTSSPDITSTRRLKAMEATNDGFKLAEMDLKIRGPGQFTGTIQSGIPDLAMASLSDINLIKTARDSAQELLKEDATLSRYPLLHARLEELQKMVHFE
ncbi:MAG: ATP-dependent DNA helicase RecG [Patescibacteria group bacterium]